MNKHIFIVNGLPGSGKDTFADILGQIVRTYKISSVGKVKEIAEYCGWDGGKEEKDRKFLSELKRITTEYNDMPFNYIKDEVDWFRNEFHNDNIREHCVMLIDIREPWEIDRAVKAFDAKTIFIENHRAQPVVSNRSDASVFDYIYDYVISNDGDLGEFKNNIQNWWADYWFEDFHDYLDRLTDEVLKDEK